MIPTQLSDDAGPAGLESEGFDGGDFDPPDPVEIAGPRTRRGFRSQFAAGLRGLKHALRRDSSLFAHAYRALLVALTAALLGIGPLEWCLLACAFGLVLMAQLTHSALDVLACAVADSDDPYVRAAREIATAGVLVSVTLAGAISVTVLTLKFGDQLGWWR